MVNARRGYTLTELLIAMAIGGILAAAALPAYRDLVKQQHALATMTTLFGALQLARQTATFERATTTICPLQDTVCGSDWRNGFLVFIDRDRDGKLGPNERVLAQGEPVPSGAALTWKSFRGRSFLQFTSHGLTRAENGSFVYCASTDVPGGVMKIVINTAGRARYVVDNNHDGQFDDESGSVRCPR